MGNEFLSPALSPELFDNEYISDAAEKPSARRKTSLADAKGMAKTAISKAAAKSSSRVDKSIIRMSPIRLLTNSALEPSSHVMACHPGLEPAAHKTCAAVACEPISKSRKATVVVNTKYFLPETISKPSSKPRKAIHILSPRFRMPDVASKPSSESDAANARLSSIGLMPHLSEPIDPQITQTIEVIREYHRERQDFLRAEGDMTRRIKAVCRRLAGVSFSDDKKTTAAKMAEADRLYQVAIGKAEGKDSEVVRMICASRVEGRAVLEEHRKRPEKMMVLKAKSLPVAPFVESVKGLGFLGLAQVIGEAGDLSLYSNPAKLWKRFGLAPYDGKAGSQWRRERGGLNSEEWTELGYSPKRRSVSFVVGEGLIKVSRGPYKAVYDARKQYEVERYNASGKPVLSSEEAKRKKAVKGEYTPLMAASRRAQRYMEKRLLRDLWRAWRGLPQHGAEEVSDGES